MPQKLLLVNAAIRDTNVLAASCLTNVSFVLYDYQTDTYASLLQKIGDLGISSFDEVGFIFEANAYAPSFKLLGGQVVDSTLCGIELAEPALDSWSEFRNFMNALKSGYAVQIVDFFACDFYSNPDWKYVLNMLEVQVGVHIRASTDATGNMANGGNWIMESDNTNIQSIYFNENIADYLFTFASTVLVNTIITQAMVDVAANWPMTIAGGTVSSPVTITFASNLTINSATKYFIVGSQYVTIDGLNYTVTISATDYPGLVQNGTPTAAGYSNVTVQNIIIAPGSATIAGGWIGQSYFGAGLNSTTTCTNNNIINCVNNANIAVTAGCGIVGSYCGANWGNLIVSKCINTGNLSNTAFGIAGAFAGSTFGNILLIYCINTGNITGSASIMTSGFVGSSAGGLDITLSATGYGRCTIQNCYNTGSCTSGTGIFYGNAAGFQCNGYPLETCVSTINCCSIGVIASGGGGIYGLNAGYSCTSKQVIQNCYVTNSDSYYAGGAILTYITVTNSALSALGAGAWSDTTASTTLTGVTDESIWTDTNSASTTTPYTLSVFVPAPTSAPTGLSATYTITNNTTALGFTGVTGQAVYNYRYSTDGGITWTMRSPVSRISPISIPNVGMSSIKNITLSAINYNGIGPTSLPPSTVYGVGNKLVGTYIQGFFDISGGDLNVRNASKLLVGGDASFNGVTTFNNNQKVVGANDLSLNGRLFVGSDASLNGRLFVGGDVSVNGILRANYPAGSIPASAIVYTTDICMNRALTVGGDVSMNTNVKIAAALKLSGPIEMADGSAMLTSSVNLDINSNVGTAWTQRATALNWTSISFSATGQYGIAVADNNYIWGSIDYGVTWTQRTSDTARAWLSCSISSSGQYQSAVTSSASNYIYTSSSYGVSWTQQTSSTAQTWVCISMAASGQYQVAATSANIYVSTNYGVNWASKSAPATITCMSISSTGQYQTIGVSPGNIWTSADYGITWTSRATSLGWQRISISSNGKYQTATVYLDYIYTSSDYGVTWTSRATDTTRSWRSICMTADGMVQMATLSVAGYVWKSINYGVTWAQCTNSTSLNYYISVAISANGQYIAACHSTSGNIYTSVTPYIDSVFTQITVLGVAKSNGATVSSDYRLKTGVYTLDETYTVDHLRPVKFTNKNSNIDDFGIIAHELQEQYPCLVKGEKDGAEYQHVNYNGLLGILVNEVQQLKRKIKDVKQKIGM